MDLQPILHILITFFSFAFIHCSYETTNGMKVRQTSYMVGNDRVVVGYFSYIGPDGKVYTTHYTADKYGYRATSSNSPAPENAVQPLPFVSSTPAPFVSSTPPPFVSSTPAPFISSTPFAAPTPFISSTPPFNNVPYSTNYRGPYQQFGFAPSTASPIVSSSTPFATTASPFSDTRRPHFPIYVQPSVPFQGYTYNNPRINTPYSVVSQQTPEPFFPSSTESPPNRFYATQPSNMNSRITTTLGPPQFARDFNAIPSSTFSPFEDNPPVQFRKYIPPVSVVTSTPRPFNSFSSNQPDTVIITPKPLFNQAQLPNSLSFNQNANLLPPYLSVGPLNSLSGPQNIPQDNFNFINGQPFEYNSQVRPWPQSVAPLAVTNLNYRKKRDFDKS